MMLSKAPLPAWVNMSPEVYNLRMINQRIAMGVQFDESGRAAMAEANTAQFNYLSSGRLLFNDEAGVLLNSLADRIMKNQPEERKMLNIYVYYSTGTNAIVFPNGLIIVELGLIAQLENEDQLAFVLCHEIAHFLQGDYAMLEDPYQAEYSTTEELTYLEYLRKREKEADLLGFELYEAAGFSTPEATRYFDVRNDNRIVPTALPFDMNFFSNEQFHFPAEFNSSQVAPDTIPESTFKSSSQNSFKERKKYLVEYFKIKDFVRVKAEPDSKFRWVNQLAIYNCGLISLETDNVCAAIYIGYYLHTTDSSARDAADFLVAKTLYHITAAQSGLPNPEQYVPITSEETHLDKFQGLFDFYHPEPEPKPDSRGYITQVEAFLNHMVVREIMLLTIDWTWRYSQRTSSNKTLAMELCERSISIYCLNKPVPVDSVGHVRITEYPGRSEGNGPKSTGVKKKSKSDDPFRIIQEMIREEGIKILEPEKKDTTRKAGGYRYINTQLKTLADDSSFRACYTAHQTLDPRFDYVPPKSPQLDNDSLYLMGSQHIWLVEVKRTSFFELKPLETESHTKTHVQNIKTVARVNKVGLNSADPLSPDSLTIDTYNNFCIASLVFSEMTVLEQNYASIPLAYRTEFDSVCRISPARYAITDYSITRKWRGSRCYTYRQTTLYDLKEGRIAHSWTKAGKGMSTLGESRIYYGKIFQFLKPPPARK